MTADYELMNDIDCSTILNFEPLGNITTIFRGRFYGNFKMISNLKIQINASQSYIGLFGYASNCTIQNLIMGDVTINVNSSSYVGSLVGYLIYSSIYNIHLTTSNQYKRNTIAGGGNYCGSIIGQIVSCIIDNITVQNTLVDFPNAYYVGGLFGFSITSDYQPTTMITNCHNIGKNFFFFLN